MTETVWLTLICAVAFLGVLRLLISACAAADRLREESRQDAAHRSLEERYAQYDHEQEMARLGYHQEYVCTGSHVEQLGYIGYNLPSVQADYAKVWVKNEETDKAGAEGDRDEGEEGTVRDQGRCGNTYGYDSQLPAEDSETDGIQGA